MQHVSQYIKNRSPWSWLVLGMVLVFFYLTFRNAGLYTVVLSDEWTYSQFSRLIPLRDVGAPSYLYFLLFKSSNVCGDGFLECTRQLNVILLLASAPFIFLVAKRVCSNGVAVLLALGAVAGPINVYTAWFMPESMYYLGFWVTSWLIVRFHEHQTPFTAAHVGAAIGLLALVKVHAMFLLPGTSLFVFYSVISRTGTKPIALSLRRACMFAVIIVASAAIVRFGLGWVAAGSRGLSLYGSVYENMAKYSESLRKPMAQMVALALSNLRGHLMALALLYGVPVASLAVMIFNPKTYKSAPSIHTALTVYTTIILITLLAVTVMFTASVAGNGPYETNVRLHMRYYDFCLPLLGISLAAQLQLNNASSSKKGRMAAAALMIAILATAVFFLLALFKPSYVDGPEIDVLATSPVIVYVFAIMATINLLIWAWNRKLGCQVFLFVFFPIYTLSSMLIDAHKVRGADHADAYVRAGIFAHQYLNDHEKDHLTIIGADPAGIFKAQFYVDNIHVKLLPQERDAPLNPDAIDPKGWLLVIGDAQAPEHALAYIKHRDFSLFQMQPPESSEYDVDFSGAILNGFLKGVLGLSGAESQGRWSDQKNLRFDFARDLPQSMTLRLSIQGFGPNVGQQLKVRIGDEEHAFLLPARLETKTLQFKNSGGMRSIEMEVPHPISPKDLGLGDDTRHLGAMFSKMSIEAAGVRAKTVDTLAN